jgi:hypothetical protein
MVNCFIKSLGIIFLIIIVIIIIAAITAFFLLRYVKNNFLKNYRLSIKEYCKNLPAIQYEHQVYRPNINGVYEYNLSKALLDISLAVTQGNCVNLLPIPNPPGFTDQKIIIGTNRNNTKKLNYCTIFNDSNNNNILIVFTGTFFMTEWVSDISYPLVPGTILNNYIRGIRVHEGFYDVYISIRSKIWNRYFEINKNNTVKNVYITGHSLGGALSTLCAFDFAGQIGNAMLIHYAFAPPRSGNPEYAYHFNRILPTSIRVVNTEDYVPNLPPSVFISDYYYEQTTGEVSFTANLRSVAANHIQAYKLFLPKNGCQMSLIGQSSTSTHQ